MRIRIRIRIRNPVEKATKLRICWTYFRTAHLWSYDVQIRQFSETDRPEIRRDYFSREKERQHDGNSVKITPHTADCAVCSVKLSARTFGVSGSIFKQCSESVTFWCGSAASYHSSVICRMPTNGKFFVCSKIHVHQSSKLLRSHKTV